MGPRSKQPVLVARATLSGAPAPVEPAGTVTEATAPVEPAGTVTDAPTPASRRDLHRARRRRLRDAAVGLGVLAAALGTTVAVLDMVH